LKISINNKIFRVDPGPFETGWRHIGSGNWEPETFRIIDHFVGAGDTVLDLGAWAGPITLYTAHTAGKVIAVDPDPSAFSQLKKNVDLNPSLSPRVRCFQLAIAGKAGALPLYARKAYGESSSSLLNRTRDKLSSELVIAKTLGSFIDSENIRKVDFIKMDIEGGEFAVLEEMGNYISRLGFPTLYVSFHYNYLSEYQYRKSIGSGLISRALMKAGIDLFKKCNKKVIQSALSGLSGYTYLYTSSGHKMEMHELLRDPLLIKKYNFVFSNKEWQ
jgi:FkbM family methyltransferase